MCFYYENELAGKEKARLESFQTSQVLMQFLVEGGLWSLAATT